jgi:hypothetical protein
MLNLWNRLLRFRDNQRGSVIIEFALTLPFMLLLFAGLTEYGRAYFQANAIEKGLRAATVYAARAGSPLSPADRVIAGNILKTGTADGSGDWLAGGWGKPGAGYAITVRSYELDGVAIPVIRIEANVPLAPLVPELLIYVGLGDFTISLAHEQAYVGL